MSPILFTWKNHRPGLWLSVAAVLSVISMNTAVADTRYERRVGTFVHLGETRSSSLWYDTATVSDNEANGRKATLVQNTSVEVEYTTGGRDSLKSIAYEVEINCAARTYRELGERHFTDYFMSGRNIYNETYAESREEVLKFGEGERVTGMHAFVRSVCRIFRYT